jgi:hypothetical protein
MREKRGQVTLFVIVAIVIVAFAILIYLFYPEISSTLGFSSQNPSQFMQACLEEELEETVEALSLRGGSVNPEHFILYGGEKIEYLCYTGENYKTCVMQKPLLQKSIQDEIATQMDGSIRSCMKDMKNSFEKKGFEVQMKSGQVEVELLPKRIVLKFDEIISIQKTDGERYTSMYVSFSNNLYELVSIATSILNFEARFGDSETTSYMNYYRDLKVEKKKLSEGSTVYILTDRNTENKFQFASRSLAWPPGIQMNKY